MIADELKDEGFKHTLVWKYSDFSLLSYLELYHNCEEGCSNPGRTGSSSVWNKRARRDTFVIHPLTQEWKSCILIGWVLIMQSLSWGEKTMLSKTKKCFSIFDLNLVLISFLDKVCISSTLRYMLQDTVTWIGWRGLGVLLDKILSILCNSQ